MKTPAILSPALMTHSWSGTPSVVDRTLPISKPATSYTSKWKTRFVHTCGTTRHSWNYGIFSSWKIHFPFILYAPPLMTKWSNCQHLVRKIQCIIHFKYKWHLGTDKWILADVVPSWYAAELLFHGDSRVQCAKIQSSAVLWYSATYCYLLVCNGQ